MKIKNLKVFNAVGLLTSSAVLAVSLSGMPAFAYADEIGLSDVCEVVDSGIAMCGCDIAHISEEALSYVNNADIIMAKGQANFETLFGEGYPVYYLLLCKCDMFVARFAMEKFAPVFMKEERIIIHNK